MSGAHRSSPSASPSFWDEHPEWAGRRLKADRPPPTCRVHGTPKVRQTAKSKYRCPECEYETWKRGGDTK